MAWPLGGRASHWLRRPGSGGLVNCLRPLECGWRSRWLPWSRSPLPPGHLSLALVIERQAKGIAKGHQGPFGGIGFGLLDGGFMGQAQVGVDAMACSRALAHQGPPVSGGNGDAHAGDVGHAPAGFLFAPNRSFGLSNAAGEEGLALPAVKAKCGWLH